MRKNHHLAIAERLARKATESKISVEDIHDILLDGHGGSGENGSLHDGAASSDLNVNCYPGNDFGPCYPLAFFYIAGQRHQDWQGPYYL